MRSKAFGKVGQSHNTELENWPNYSDLNSLHNQILFLNLKLEESFSNQRNEAESIFYEKIEDMNKLREKIFKISSQIISMTNISKIEEYLSYTYNKIMTIEPKLVNSLENVEDFKNNVNYGLDRLILEDNLASDETLLEANVQVCSKSYKNLLEQHSNKPEQIKLLKFKFETVMDIFEKEKLMIEEFWQLMEKFKEKNLDDCLCKLDEKITRENERLEKNLLED